jgi:hypothetical protein
VSPPAPSMARRAARMRSTARATSYSGREASPVESSIDNAATPVSTARRTLSATPSGSAAKPPSKSAFTGRSVASTISRKCASAISRVMPLSGRARDHANPELVVAIALKPMLCR